MKVTFYRLGPRKSGLPGLALLLALASWSCTPGPEVTWQPVLRLVDHLEEAQPHEGARPCEVGKDSRLTLGCPQTSIVFARTVGHDGGDSVRIEGPLPADLEHGIVLLDPVLIPDPTSKPGGDSPIAAPPFLLDGTHPAFTVDLPLSPALREAKKLKIRIAGQRIPETPLTFRTRELRLPANPMLQVSLAIAPNAARAGASPTLFHIRAHGEFGTRVLLEEKVDPGVSEPRWMNHRVDLSPLAGKTVRLEFSSELSPGRGMTGKRFSLPLWGNPQILDERPRDGQRNIVLISLDTLRGDFVGRNYAGQPLTPLLDARRAEGASFGQVIAPYPSTTASHASLFTSTYPGEHQALDAKDRLPATLPTLPEILAAHGYETAAFTENGMLAAGVGFQRGFDDYYENRGIDMWDARGDIEETFNQGLQWLSSHRGDKFFVFLHTYEVHMPYSPPAPYDGLQEEVPPGARKGISKLRNRYAGEVAYTDSVVTRVFETLEELGMAENTLVAVTADHGDEFGEHGSVGHSNTIYDEVLRVPLLLWAPGLIPPGLEIPDQVSLIDLAPTLLDLVDIAPASSLRGESLAPVLLEGKRVGHPIRYAEGPARKRPTGRSIAARTERYKWIGQQGIPAPLEIYDLQADPGEQKNLVDDPDLRARGLELLDRYRAFGPAKASSAPPQAGTGTTAPPAEERPLDPQTQRKLEALGYLD